MMPIPFFVRPLDPLYFGAPRSFTMGEAHHGRTQFPPTPWTFQGLVRSHLLRRAKRKHSLADRSRAAQAERTGLIGTPDGLPEGWRLAPPLPAQLRRTPVAEELEPWLPAPRFLVRPEQASRAEAPIALRLVSTRERILSDRDSGPARTGASPSEALGVPQCGDKLRPLGGWMNPENLLWALRGGGAGWDLEGFGASLPPFVGWESRPGVAIAPDGTAEDQMLHVREMVRFAPSAGLYGELEAPTWPDAIPRRALSEGIGHAGRKGAAVQFERAPEQVRAWRDLIEAKHLEDEKARAFSRDPVDLWLYVLSPIALDRPENPTFRIATRGDVTRTVRAAIVGRPQSIGGFRMGDDRARENRPHVPAGAAWLLRVAGGSPEDRYETARSLNAAYPFGDSGFGFGFALVGLARGDQKEDGP